MVGRDQASSKPSIPEKVLETYSNIKALNASAGCRGDICNRSTIQGMCNSIIRMDFRKERISAYTKIMVSKVYLSEGTDFKNHVPSSFRPGVCVIKYMCRLRLNEDRRGVRPSSICNNSTIPPAPQKALNHALTGPKSFVVRCGLCLIFFLRLLCIG